MVNGIENFWSILKRWVGGVFLTKKRTKKSFTIIKRPSTRSALCFVSHKHKFIYYRISKVAHTTIKSFIITIDEINRTSNKRNRELNVTETQVPGMCFPENRSPKYKDYFHFTFVRNPFDRLLSCYMSKVYSLAHSNVESLQFVEAYGHLVGFKKMSFSDFVHFVTQIPNEHCDHHFAPQHRLLDLETLDFIGRFENFDQDFSYVKEQILLSDDIMPERLNTTKHDPYQNYYDDELHRMVAEKYARDLEIFNYDF